MKPPCLVSYCLHHFWSVYLGVVVSECMKGTFNDTLQYLLIKAAYYMRLLCTTLRK